MVKIITSGVKIITSGVKFIKPGHSGSDLKKIGQNSKKSKF
jgi:hypothetical protein